MVARLAVLLVLACAPLARGVDHAPPDNTGDGLGMTPSQGASEAGGRGAAVPGGGSPGGSLGGGTSGGAPPPGGGDGRIPGQTPLGAHPPGSGAGGGTDSGGTAPAPGALDGTAPALKPFGAGSDLARKAGIELQMGDLPAACQSARAALAKDPKDAKALKIESLACRAGLSAEPKEGPAEGPGTRPAPGTRDVTLDVNTRSKLLRGGAGGGAVTGPGALQAWLERIAEAKERGDDPQVILLSDEGLREFPGNLHLLNAKATAQNKLKDFKGALATADEALDVDDQDAAAHANKAFALGGLGDRAGMIASLRAAAALDPRFEAALKAALADDAAGLFGGKGGGLAKLPLAVWIGVPAVLGFFLMLIVVFLARRSAPPPAAAAPPGPSGPVTPRAIGAGDVLGGNFRIDGELGRGGMGIVYDAHDARLDRRVAIKQLQRDAGTTPADIERFLKEARLVAKLKHPNLAEIYTVLVEKGEPLLVFEYVDGRTLDKVIATNRGVPPAQAERILEGVSGALDYAHGLKIIHRDLKPSNVMVSRDGATVKVMDFGIAHQATSTGLTRTEASGTPPYMSPEQGMGSVSKSSDLYALGVMTYEMLAGARPFDGPDFLEPKLRKEFTPVTQRGRSLPAGLDAFFASALDPDPTKRPATGAAFLLAFRQACS